MYASNAQREFFNANRGKLGRQGVDVDEWNQASKGAKLPDHAKGAMKLAAKPPKKKR